MLLTFVILQNVNITRKCELIIVDENILSVLPAYAVVYSTNWKFERLTVTIIYVL